MNETVGKARAKSRLWMTNITHSGGSRLDAHPPRDVTFATPRDVTFATNEDMQAENRNSLRRGRRRSLTARLPSGNPLSESTWTRQKKKRREKTLFDGKLLAQDYLRQMRNHEADTVHALARTLRSELQMGMKQREAEFMKLSSRVGGMEKKLDTVEEVKASLQAIEAQLARLSGPPSSDSAAPSDGWA